MNGRSNLQKKNVNFEECSDKFIKITKISKNAPSDNSKNKKFRKLSWQIYQKIKSNEIFNVIFF